jgi:hypothetical protein
VRRQMRAKRVVERFPECDCLRTRTSLEACRERVLTLALQRPDRLEEGLRGEGPLLMRPGNRGPSPKRVVCCSAEKPTGCSQSTERRLINLAYPDLALRRPVEADLRRR